jgi:hypothetical protein
MIEAAESPIAERSNRHIAISALQGTRAELALLIIRSLSEKEQA